MLIDDPETVFSSVFPGPQMPWNKNASLQLQDMYDQVYSYLIGTSRDRETILQILGQVIIAQPVPLEVRSADPPPNYSSPNWITAILDLEQGRVMEIITELHLLLEVENGDDEIKIRHPAFLEFLLDRTRSQDLFVDLDKARSVPRDVPAYLRWIFITECT